jgi:hypothetical protein
VSSTQTHPIVIDPATWQELPPLKRRRRRLYVALGLIAIGLLMLLVVVLTGLDEENPSPAAPQATSPTVTPTVPLSTTPPSAVPTSTIAAAPVADPEQMRQVVTAFYSSLPADTARAWTLLGPAVQAQGQAEFETFWAQVKDLRIGPAPRVDGNTVVVDIEYTQAGRGRVRETHQHEILLRDGTAVINSDQVVATGDDKPIPPGRR